MEKRRAILLSAVLVFVLLVSGVFAEQLGIEIDLTLPRKRIKGLEMLSGGEKSLVLV